MSSYLPPSENLSSFNPTVFIGGGSASTDGVSLQTADSRYLKKSGGILTGGISTPSILLDGTDINTTINLKAPINDPTFTGTVSGISKSMVGLSNVDNTSDANKPVSSATTTQLNLKAPLDAPTFTGTVSGISKSMVGLSNVDNTSDANKPVSSATTTQLNLKATINAPTFTGTATFNELTLPGDKTLQLGDSVAGCSLIYNTSEGGKIENNEYDLTLKSTAEKVLIDGATGIELEPNTGSVQINGNCSMNGTFTTSTAMNTANINVDPGGVITLGSGSSAGYLQVKQTSASGNTFLKHIGTTGNMFIDCEANVFLRVVQSGSNINQIKLQNSSTNQYVLLYSNGTIAMRTDRDGNGNNPGIRTDVLYFNDDAARIHYGEQTENNLEWYGQRTSGTLSNIHIWRFNSNGGSSGVDFRNLSGDNNCAIRALSYTNISDDRIKENETPITDATTILNKLNPVTYDEYDNMEKTNTPFSNVGFVAQHLYYDVPELRQMVRLNQDENGDDITPLELPQGEIETTADIQEEDYETTLNWGGGEISVNYLYLIPYLVKSIQELNQRIQDLENQI